MATPNQLDSLFIPDEEQKEDEAQSSKNLFIPDEVSQETQERPENLFIPDEDVQAPSRAGAIGRTVAEELIPTTVAVFVLSLAVIDPEFAIQCTL